ncbi:MAG TPA: hypothetical protein PKE29_06710 [Phycisphaerales bacterium]|nr:hypothetical protein [Phycisphaerales bacterium]
MSGEHERTVAVAVTPTVFLAETIAASLRERGIDARVLDDAATGTWGMPMGPGNGVRVVVLERDKEGAELALADVRAESQSIDWDAVDTGGPPEAHRLVQASKARRWVWTVSMLMVPIGLFVLAYGVDRADPYIKTVGGTLLLASMVLVAYQLFPERRGT